MLYMSILKPTFPGFSIKGEQSPVLTGMVLVYTKKQHTSANNAPVCFIFQTKGECGMTKPGGQTQAPSKF